MRPPIVIVGIATSGRRSLVSDLVSRLDRQTLVPAYILLAPARETDVDASLASERVRIIYGRQGSCAQRNTIVEAAIPLNGDVLVYFDDDFVPSDDYLQKLTAALLSGSAVLAGGRVLADGALNEGIQPEEAERIIKASIADDAPSTPVPSVYGCNMAMRLDALKSRGTRFDENLPAYGLMEDTLFSFQFCKPGECIFVPSARGVHLGTKMGRTSGLKLGYSQIANPIYLWRVGSGVTLLGALKTALRAIAMNCARSLYPESYIDRRGRLKGNLLALTDAALLRLHPTRINSL